MQDKGLKLKRPFFIEKEFRFKTLMQGKEVEI
jgi:hypothetical protein